MAIRAFITKFFYLAKEKFADFIFVVLSFRPALWYLIALLVVNAAAWLAAALIYRTSTENTLILHYNIDFGISLIGSVGNIFLLPLGGMVVNLVNLAVSYSIIRYRRQSLLAHFLFAAALATNIFLFTSESMLYLINFR